MKISVALATYNGERYIEEQMDSIRLQRREPDEVVICDDCSSDKTVEIIKKYINKYGLMKTWKLYVNDKNIGYIQNFHDTFMKCTGEIIFFCDQDDIWDYEKIRLMSNIMKNNTQIGVLGSEITNFQGKEYKMKSGETSTDKKDFEVVQVEFNSENMYLQVPGCAMAVRKEFLDNAEKFWYPEFAHDEYVWKIGLCMEKIFLCKISLVNRRCHDNNTSMKKMRTVGERIYYIENLEKSYLEMEKCLNEENEKRDSYRKLLEKNIYSCKLRLSILESKKYYYAPILIIKYADTVKTIKTFLIEVLLALKEREL